MSTIRRRQFYEGLAYFGLTYRPRSVDLPPICSFFCMLEMHEGPFPEDGNTYHNKNL